MRRKNVVLVGLGVLVAAAAGGLVVYLRRCRNVVKDEEKGEDQKPEVKDVIQDVDASNEAESKEKNKNKRKKKKKGKKPAANLKERLNKCMEAVQRDGNVRSSECVDLLKTIRGLDVDSTDPDIRVSVASFLLFLQSFTMMTLENEEQLEEFKEHYLQDVDLCDELLKFDPSVLSQSEKNAFFMVKLDVVQKYKDVEKYHELFEQVKDINEKEVILALYTSVANFGRWKDFISMGERLQRDFDTQLIAFHDLSIQNPALPDLDTLFRLAKEHTKNADQLDSDQLKWCQYHPIKVQWKFVSVEGKQADVVRQSLVGLEHWKDLDVPPQWAISRQGAVFQGFGPNPGMMVPLIGLQDDAGNIILSGYRDLADENNAVIRAYEKLILTQNVSEQDPTQVEFIGKYVMENAPRLRTDLTGKPVLTITFDFKLTAVEAAGLI